jgi:Fe-S-cluster containining protein
VVERLPLRIGFELERGSAFAYACGRCSRCCSGKRIPLDPYEVARLGAHLGLGTTEVLARFTTDGGALLAVREDRTCVFLGDQGCTVHAARPLACRLYPLGRRVSPGQGERFAAVEPDPGCQGSYEGRGTIEEYLTEQQTGPYLAMADRYRAVLEKLVAALLRRPDLADCCDQANELLRKAPAPEDESLVDVDAVVGRRCAELGQTVPRGVEERVLLHLEALGEIARIDGAAV